jgi:hypothetical protein
LIASDVKNPSDIWYVVEILRILHGERELTASVRDTAALPFRKNEQFL